MPDIVPDHLLEKVLGVTLATDMNFSTSYSPYWHNLQTHRAGNMVIYYKAPKKKGSEPILRKINVYELDYKYNEWDEAQCS